MLLPADCHAFVVRNKVNTPTAGRLDASDSRNLIKIVHLTTSILSIEQLDMFTLFRTTFRHVRWPYSACVLPLLYGRYSAEPYFFRVPLVSKFPLLNTAIHRMDTILVFDYICLVKPTYNYHRIFHFYKYILSFVFCLSRKKYGVQHFGTDRKVRSGVVLITPCRCCML